VQRRRGGGEGRLVGQEPPQVGGQVRGRRVPPGRVPLDRLVDDRGEVAGDRRVEPAEAVWVGRGRLPEELVPVAAVVGRPQGQQLVEGQPEREQVAAGVGA